MIKGSSNKDNLLKTEIASKEKASLLISSSHFSNPIASNSTLLNSSAANQRVTNFLRWG